MKDYLEFLQDSLDINMDNSYDHILIPTLMYPKAI